ncbi:lipocalin/fatty-acid binding family protein [Streptomyces sp. NPDC004126]|uniref:lipocalin/fatty-acid binding family protein n=1 Tax=Streptomyces sp. NPDC004126 TaxID=3390695 RepID=UPI003D02CFE7
MSSPAGKYDLLSDPTDKAWNDFLTAVGVTDALRDAWAMIKPTTEITVTDGKWSLKNLSELKNCESVFSLGEKVPTRLEADEMDGIGGTSVFTQPAENKLVETFTVGGKNGTITRTFSADEMTTTFSFQGKTAVRKYKRTA